MKRLVVFPADPLYKYVAKGEIKTRYWNPCGIFDEVHIVSLAESDVDADQVQEVVGNARLHVHSVGRPRAWSLWAYYARVKRLVKDISPDLIRAHGPWHTGSLAVFAGKSLGIPCVVSVHNDRDAQRSYDRRPILRMVKPLENYTLSNATVVICVSNYLHHYARRHGAKNTFTVYNKVYMEQFLHERSDLKTDQLPTVLSVMRLDRQKYPECIIEALVDLPIKLKLIGQGELQDSLDKLVRSLGMDERVTFIPMVPNREIHEHYHQADIFAMATHYEGFCIPILEAMAAGLPIVACDTEPIPELIGEAGLIAEKTPEAFAAAFEKLLNDPVEAARFGSSARDRARQLAGDRMEEREAMLYDAIISQRQGALEDLLDDANRFIY